MIDVRAVAEVLGYFTMLVGLAALGSAGLAFIQSIPARLSQWHMNRDIARLLADMDDDGPHTNYNTGEPCPPDCGTRVSIPRAADDPRIPANYDGGLITLAPGADPSNLSNYLIVDDEDVRDCCEHDGPDPTCTDDCQPCYPWCCPQPGEAMEPTDQ